MDCIKCYKTMNYQLLVNCPVFRGIPENDMEYLLNKIHFQLRKFEKNEVLAIAGEEVKSLFILLSGSARGEMINYSGKTIKIEDIEAPKPLASAFLFGKENKFPVTVTANNKVKALSIPVPEFLKLLQENEQILKNYLHSISTKTQFLSRKIQFLSFKSIKEKIAHFFLQMAGDKFHSIEIKQTQQQLADMFGVTRPSLARVLGEMQQEGLIKIERKTVTILDKEKLNRILGDG